MAVFVVLPTLRWGNKPQSGLFGRYYYSRFGCACQEANTVKVRPCGRTQPVEKVQHLGNLHKSFRPPFPKGGAVKGALPKAIRLHSPCRPEKGFALLVSSTQASNLCATGEIPRRFSVCRAFSGSKWRSHFEPGPLLVKRKSGQTNLCILTYCRKIFGLFRQAQSALSGGPSDLLRYSTILPSPTWPDCGAYPHQGRGLR